MLRRRDVRSGCGYGEGGRAPGRRAHRQGRARRRCREQWPRRAAAGARDGGSARAEGRAVNVRDRIVAALDRHARARHRRQRRRRFDDARAHCSARLAHRCDDVSRERAPPFRCRRANASRRTPRATVGSSWLSTRRSSPTHATARTRSTAAITARRTSTIALPASPATRSRRARIATTCRTSGPACARRRSATSCIRMSRPVPPSATSTSLRRRWGSTDLARLPAQPCLASRVETGIAIDPSDLAFVDTVEAKLASEFGRRGDRALSRDPPRHRDRGGRRIAQRRCARHRPSRLRRRGPHVRRRASLCARRRVPAQGLTRMTDFRMDWDRIVAHRNGGSRPVRRQVHAADRCDPCACALARSPPAADAARARAIRRVGVAGQARLRRRVAHGNPRSGADAASPRPRRHRQRRHVGSPRGAAKRRAPSRSRAKRARGSSTSASRACGD